MKLTALEVSNYRSISHLRLAECGPFNVLIGKNNSGKSTILSALFGFFRSLPTTSIVSLSPSLGRRIDFHKPLQDMPIELSITFHFDESESKKLIEEIVSEIPRMKNAAEALPQKLEIVVTLQITSEFPRYSYVSKIHLKGTGPRSSESEHHTLLAVSPASAKELSSREAQITALSKQAQVLSRIVEEVGESEWANYRMELQESRRIRPNLPPFRYYLNRLASSQETEELVSPVLGFMRDEDTHQNFIQALQSYIHSLNDERTSLEKENLATPIETFSGSEEHVPQYIFRLIEKIRSVNVHYLMDRRDPIGKEEAARLLNLKVQRGGLRELQNIQDAVSALLGVRIDAFQGETTPSGHQVAELDVDDFLVEANGSGIREALRLILDVEFAQPSIVLVEEPEMHLHPGLESSMMRYLKRVSTKSQVFITTHSTNFLDTAAMNNVYLVSKSNSTSVQMVDFQEAENRIPRELGLKLSSLFMFDRLVFVEGTTDENILREWATCLGNNLGQSNVGFVSIGGSRNFLYFATEATLSFLRNRGVEMWFILDRDERDAADIHRLEEALGNRASIVVLQRRELENYLISPRALREFILQKRQLAGEPEDNITEEAVRSALAEAAEMLKEISVQKRVARITNRPAYPRFEPNLELLTDEEITQCISDQIDQQIDFLKEAKEKAKELLKKEREQIEIDWPNRKLDTVPGDELLDLACQKFGVRFNKDRDGVRIAGLLHADEIPQEIKKILNDLCRP